MAVVAFKGTRLLAVIFASWSLSLRAYADSAVDANGPQHFVQPSELEGCPPAGETSVVFYRYVGAGEMKVIEQKLEIPVTDAEGNRKIVYFTDCLYSNAEEAKESLALPKKPDYRIKFTLKGNRGRCPGKAEPKYGEPGGGNECTLDEDSPPIDVPDPEMAIEPLQ